MAGAGGRARSYPPQCFALRSREEERLTRESRLTRALRCCPLDADGGWIGGLKALRALL